MPLGYFVDAKGIIYSMHRGPMVPMKPRRDKDGYQTVSARAPGHTKSRYWPYRVHVVVCLTFVGPRPPGQLVRHLDGSRENNVPRNLVWGTSLENEQDAFRHGTRTQMGETHAMAKLTAEQVREIRSAPRGGKELAVRYGVSYTTVKVIRSGKTWRSLEVSNAV